MVKIRSDDPKNLRDFACLAFDCFGTLVDDQAGVYKGLGPLLDRLDPASPLKHDRSKIISLFTSIEESLTKTKPNVKHSILLAEAYLKLAEKLSLPTPEQAEADAFGATVPAWPAFPDTVDALKRLQKYFKLVILSNTDLRSFTRVLSGPLSGVKFEAVYTAEEIGSFKPDLNNFHYLVKHVDSELGIGKDRLLMTAHGLKSDHCPAKDMQITSAWIARDDADAGPEVFDGLQDKLAFTWQFSSMADMADAVEADFNRSA
ncbi:MAG: hypothetical protein Q9191_002460 [Dirinaria sp. TL-2023a]